MMRCDECEDVAGIEREVPAGRDYRFRWNLGSGCSPRGRDRRVDDDSSFPDSCECPLPGAAVRVANDSVSASLAGECRNHLSHV